MGNSFHLFGLNNLDEIQNEDKVILMTGLNKRIHLPRSPFHNAMFGEKNVIQPMNIRNYYTGKEVLGFVGLREECIYNFAKFAISRINPFTNKRFFKENAENFLNKINNVSKNFRYLLWEDVPDESAPIRKIIEELKWTGRFYDQVRKQSALTSNEMETAFKRTYWNVEKRELVPLVDDKYNDSSKPSQISLMYYGDI